MINQRQQRGITMIGVLFVGIVIVFVAIVTMKLIPAYTDFFAVKNILKGIGGEPEINSMSNAEIRTHFEKRAMVDNIATVRPVDLKINRDNGKTVISVDYTFETPLVGNLSLLANFSASSDGRESKIAQQLE